MVKELYHYIYLKETLCAFIALLCLSLLIFRAQAKNYRVKRWKHSLKLKYHDENYKKLFQDINGFKLSKQAREEQDAIEYVYGEIEFLSFIALLSLVKPNKDTVFYDLGSGVGNAVIACAMVFPIKKSVGIELLTELYQGACLKLEQFQNMPEYRQQANKCSFILGDYFFEDLSDATLIFINSTSLIGAPWEELCSRFTHFPQLKIIITTSKTLVNTDFELIISTKVQMSWGVVSANIHVRKEISNNQIENIE